MKKYLFPFLLLALISCGGSDEELIDSKIPIDSEEIKEPINEKTPIDLEEIEENEDKDLNEFEKPGPTNTGPSDASILVKSGSLIVDGKWSKGGSGTVEDPFIVENIDISGILKIKTSNVIVRNFKVVANALYPVQTNNVDGVTNVTLEDGEIIGGNESSATILAKNGVTLRRLRLHETKGDGIKIQGSDFVLESCWIYNMGLGEKAHADGIQGTVNGEGVRWKNHKYIGNFFDMSISKLKGRYKSNATIFLHNNKKLKEGAGIDNILVENNWLIGGNYSLQIAKGMSGVIIKNNKFGYKKKDVRFGNLRISSPAEESGSVYYDTGKPIND